MTNRVTSFIVVIWFQGIALKSVTYHPGSSVIYLSGSYRLALRHQQINNVRMNNIFSKNMHTNIFLISGVFILSFAYGGCRSPLDEPRRAIESAKNGSDYMADQGTENMVFVSKGMQVPLNTGERFFSENRQRVLSVKNGSVYFEGAKLDFMCTDHGSYIFYSQSGGWFVFGPSLFPQGKCSITQNAFMSFSQWIGDDLKVSMDRWHTILKANGCTDDRFGFLPKVKFIDDSRSNMLPNDSAVVTIDVSNNKVLWEGTSSETSACCRLGNPEARPYCRGPAVFC